MNHDELVNKLFFNPDYIEELELTAYRKRQLLEAILKEISKEEQEKSRVFEYWDNINESHLVNEVDFFDLEKLKKVYGIVENASITRKVKAPRAIKEQSNQTILIRKRGGGDLLKLHQYFNMDSGLPNHEERQKDLVNFLKQDLQGARGKYIAFMIRGMTMRRIKMFPLLKYQNREDLFNAMRLELGISFSSESVNKYMEVRLPQSKLNENLKYKSEFQAIRYKIEAFLQSIGISA